MSLTAGVIALIRDEIGDDTDFADNIADFAAPQIDSLENIYTDENRGNYSVLRTALICWRRRRNHLQARSWDIATEGSLLTRSQRLKQMDQQILRYESLVDTTLTGRNQVVQNPIDAEEAAALSNTEF